MHTHVHVHTIQKIDYSMYMYMYMYSTLNIVYMLDCTFGDIPLIAISQIVCIFWKMNEKNICNAVCLDDAGWMMQDAFLLDAPTVFVYLTSWYYNIKTCLKYRHNLNGLF